MIAMFKINNLVEITFKNYKKKGKILDQQLHLIYVFV